jgi:hypothetical protein
MEILAPGDGMGQGLDGRVIITPPSEIKEFKRCVTWADGTAEAPSARLAVSIPRHKTNQVVTTIRIHLLIIL